MFARTARERRMEMYLNKLPREELFKISNNARRSRLQEMAQDEERRRAEDACQPRDYNDAPDEHLYDRYHPDSPWAY